MSGLRDQAARRGAWGFGLGGGVALSLWAASASRPGYLLAIAGFAISGVIGGASLAPFVGGWLHAVLASVGFGLGFLLMGGILFCAFLPIQGMSGFLGPALFILVGVTAGFTIAGAVGGLSLWLGNGVFLRSLISFAAGGSVGGALLVVLLGVIELTGPLRIGLLRNIVVLVLGLACLVLSYALGGAPLGTALAKQPFNRDVEQITRLKL
jgi:hypothetical protein